MSARSLSLSLSSVVLSQLLALQQEDEERKTGRSLKRGEGGGLRGFCSVSRNLLTPLAAAQRVSGGGDARRVVEVSSN